ncbi:MAG: XdhC family protein [Alphaproteobacteria bacterium]
MKQKIFYQIASSKQPVTLITAYAVSGSTPCQSGSMLAVFNDGSRVGTVGGGLVEAKAIELAQNCLKQKTSDVLTVDMLGQNTSEEEMICGGTVKLWVEYIEDVSPFKLIIQNLDNGDLVVRIGKISFKGQTKAIINANKEVVFGSLEQVDYEAVSETISLNKNTLKDNIFYQFIAPCEKLLILGGGHVGRALANIAANLGFETTVADFRAEFANSSLYPENVTCIKGELAETIDNFNLSANSYVVVVSPSHITDLDCARALMKKNYRYAGLMGSRRKVKMIFDTLEQEGFDRYKIETINAPIGLDVGAVSPEEIAVSILAEIISVRRNSAHLETFQQMKKERRQKA